MELIFSAALCSVLVSILLKFSKSRGFDVMQMIAWNYAIASVLCFFWFKPDLNQVSLTATPWWLITLLGIALPSIFLLLSKSLEHAGIIKTEIAQRLSVVLSLGAAYFLFQETFTYLKIMGIGLGLAAVLFIIFSKSSAGKTQSKKAGWFLFMVWLGYALVDVLLKYSTSLGLKFAVSLNLMFVFAFILSIGFLVLKKTVWTFQNFLAGLCLGVLNFANIALYVKAHMLLKDSPAIVFVGMNILVVVFGVVAGILIFKEKLNPKNTIGIFLAIAGLMCLAYAI